jgi:branched-subunit amino acid transport protein
MMLTIFGLVLGMAIVTYVPRMLPMVILQNIQLPPFWSRFLRNIPYAALGALIFPGILHSTGGNTASAAVGMGASVLLAFFRMHLLLVVLVGILAAYLVTNLHIA